MESTNLAPFRLGQPTNSQLSGAVIVLQAEIDELRKEMKKHKDEIDEIKKNHKEENKKLRKDLVTFVNSAQAWNTSIVKILQDKFGLKKGTVKKMARATLNNLNKKRQR